MLGLLYYSSAIPTDLREVVKNGGCCIVGCCEADAVPHMVVVGMAQHDAEVLRHLVHERIHVSTLMQILHSYQPPLLYKYASIENMKT